MPSVRSTVSDIYDRTEFFISSFAKVILIVLTHIDACRSGCRIPAAHMTPTTINPRRLVRQTGQVDAMVAAAQCCGSTAMATI